MKLVLPDKSPSIHTRIALAGNQEIPPGCLHDFVYCSTLPFFILEFAVEGSDFLRVVAVNIFESTGPTDYLSGNGSVSIATFSEWSKRATWPTVKPGLKVIVRVANHTMHRADCAVSLLIDEHHNG